MSNQHDKMLDFSTNHKYKLKSEFTVSHPGEWKHPYTWKYQVLVRMPSRGWQRKAQGSNQPGVCGATYKLRTYFTFLNVLKKWTEKLHFVTHEFQILVSLSKRSLVISIHLWTAWGCFSVTTAELHSCDRDHVIHRGLSIFYLVPHRKVCRLPV